MSNVVVEQNLNVIAVDFGSNPVMEQNSEPLDDIIAEFDTDIFEDYGPDQAEVTSVDPFRVEYKDSSLEMGNKIIDQINSLKDKMLRLNYYLGEINLD